MLSLASTLHIPAHITFSVVGQDAFLLNTRTNQYFYLEEVGTRLWQLLNEGRSLAEASKTLLGEYQVDPALLEQDLLALLGDLQENGLIEVVAEDHEG